VVGRVWSRRSGLLIRSSLLVTECSFAEGMACVDMAGNRRYIDQVRETIVIQPQFGAGSHGFSKGLAGVQIDKKMGFIDKSGKTVVPPRYKEAHDFWERSS